MRYHYPVWLVCEGTSETVPCTAGLEGKGAVGQGLVRVSDCGPELGKADKVEAPEGWRPLKVSGPLTIVRPEVPHPMVSPWVMAAKTGKAQMAFVCPKCAEHLKIEDYVAEAKTAADKGQLQ